MLALKPSRENFSCNMQMVPVAYFQQGDDFPVSESSLFTYFCSVLFIFLYFVDVFGVEFCLNFFISLILRISWRYPELTRFPVPVFR